MNYRTLAAALLAALLALWGAHEAIAGTPKTHHVAIQISQDDPAVMNLVLNNVDNMMTYYKEHKEDAQIEVVAFGPGLHMLLADSPVKDRLDVLAMTQPNVRFDACHNTLKSMEKAAGHPLALLPEAHLVPAGVIRLVELEEQGWSYIRP